MITEAEMKWIQQALATKHVSGLAKAKTYRVIAQIFQAAADRIELDFIDRVDDKIHRQYQDLQNQKLVDLLRID